MSDECPEGRIEFTTVNAGNLRWVHMGTVQAMQAVDRETCTAVVIPGATTRGAARILRVIVDGEVNDVAAERSRVGCFLDDLADRANDDGLLGRRGIITQTKHQIQNGEHYDD